MNQQVIFVIATVGGIRDPRMRRTTRNPRQMLRVSTNKRPSHDKLATEHRVPRGAGQRRSADWSWVGCAYDFFLTMNRWPETQPQPLAECAAHQSGSAVPETKTTS